jgi:hypothetical protein
MGDVRRRRDMASFIRRLYVLNPNHDAKVQ